MGAMFCSPTLQMFCSSPRGFKTVARLEIIGLGASGLLPSYDSKRTTRVVRKVLRSHPTRVRRLRSSRPRLSHHSTNRAPQKEDIVLKSPCSFDNFVALWMNKIMLRVFPALAFNYRALTKNDAHGLPGQGFHINLQTAMLSM